MLYVNILNIGVLSTTHLNKMEIALSRYNLGPFIKTIRGYTAEGLLISLTSPHILKPGIIFDHILIIIK